MDVVDDFHGTGVGSLGSKRGKEERSCSVDLHVYTIWSVNKYGCFTTSMYALLPVSPNEPEFAVQVAKSFLVVFPVAIKFDGVILSPLEDLINDTTFVYYGVRAAVCYIISKAATPPLYTFHVQKK